MHVPPFLWAVLTFPGQCLNEGTRPAYEADPSCLNSEACPDFTFGELNALRSVPNPMADGYV